MKIKILMRLILIEPIPGSVAPPHAIISWNVFHASMLMQSSIIAIHSFSFPKINFIHIVPTLLDNSQNFVLQLYSSHSYFCLLNTASKIFHFYVQ